MGNFQEIKRKRNQTPNLSPANTKSALLGIAAISDYDLLYAAKRMKAMSRKERRTLVAELKKRRLEVPE